MTAWLVLTPKGHKLTDSTLGRVAAAVLLSAGAAADVSGCAGVGRKPDSVSEAARAGATRPARDLCENTTPHLRGLDRTQFWLGLPVGKRPGRGTDADPGGGARHQLRVAVGLRWTRLTGAG